MVDRGIVPIVCHQDVMEDRLFIKDEDGNTLSIISPYYLHEYIDGHPLLALENMKRLGPRHHGDIEMRGEGGNFILAVIPLFNTPHHLLDTIREVDVVMGGISRDEGTHRMYTIASRSNGEFLAGIGHIERGGAMGDGYPKDVSYYRVGKVKGMAPNITSFVPPLGDQIS
jgi:hypothetical protein